MRVFAFRHIPNEDIGHIGPVLESRGIIVDRVDLYLGAPVPDIAGAAGLIFMGGPMSVNDPLPWVEIETGLIRQAIERRIPVFGVCLGAQLIAKAMGAEVRRAACEEIGWFDIRMTPGAAADPLFQGLPTSFPVLQWHNETFDIPSGGTLLATSELCPNQAFRVGESAYGIQFHPEVTPAMIDDWSRELAAPVNSRCHEQHLRSLSEKLFGRWSVLLQASP